VVASRRFQLIAAFLRDRRLWGEHKDQGLRPDDSLFDARLPVGRRLNGAEVQPDFLAPCRQRLLQAIDKFDVRRNPPIGDERVKTRRFGGGATVLR
jgi:hypothetical protein